MNGKISENFQKLPHCTLKLISADDNSSQSKVITPDFSEKAEIYVKSVMYEKCSAQVSAAIHAFEYNTLTLIISGKGYFDGILLGKGEGFIVKEGCIAEYAPDKDDPWTYCRMDFSGSSAARLLRKAGLTENKCIFASRSHDKIASMLCEAVDADYKKTDVVLHLSSVLIDTFAYLTAEKPITFTEKSVSVMEKRVERGIDFIKRNYTEKNCISLLAKEENVNMRYLSRLFLKYSGCSPQSYLIKVRTEKAKRLLRTSNEPIGSVGHSVGYDDGMQFSKMFKKHTGMSPSEYRKGKENMNDKD